MLKFRGIPSVRYARYAGPPIASNSRRRASSSPTVTESMPWPFAIISTIAR